MRTKPLSSHGLVARVHAAKLVPDFGSCCVAGPMVARAATSEPDRTDSSEQPGSERAFAA